MDRYDLGDIFSIATLRISKEVSELYEALFDDRGNPITDLEAVNEKIKWLQRQVGLEADLIRQSIKEYNND